MPIIAEKEGDLTESVGSIAVSVGRSQLSNEVSAVIAAVVSYDCRQLDTHTDRHTHRQTCKHTQTDTMRSALS